jgi:5-methyltetrahydrofolate--homocysteine methyltransferase
MNRTILDLISERPVLLDGGLGTELIRRGLPQGACPETWNTERPEMVRAVHASYFDAGADAVSTNSFGGSRIKLAAHGLDARTVELNAAAARIAREAAPAGRFVAGSMGPTGKFLQPQGEFTEAEFEKVYAEQAGALALGGADFLLIETQYDLREALAALRAARSAAPSLPVFVTLTFNAYPRGYFTLMGNTVAAAVEALEKEGASAVGANCTLDSREMVGLVRAFRQATRLPIVAQANAGKPALEADGGVSYSQSLEEYVGFIPAILEAGANVVGGCCGTGPDHIRKMSELVHKRNIGERRDM